MVSKSLNIAKHVSGYFIAKYMHFKTDAYIISYPKCGRNWLTVLIGKALCEKFNLPDEIMLDTYKVTAASGILRTQMTYDNSCEGAGYKYYELPTDKRKHSKKKVIFLIRNVKTFWFLTISMLLIGEVIIRVIFQILFVVIYTGQKKFLLFIIFGMTRAL